MSPNPINTAGMAILKFWEKGPKGTVALTPYLCPAGVWTIGWGHTKDVTAKSPPITAEQAEQLLDEDLDWAEARVDELCTLPPNENQRAAMILLCFNIGPGWNGSKKPKGAKDGFRQSDVLKFHNQGRFVEAEKAFANWRKSNGKVLNGLVARRAEEAALYMKPVEVAETYAQPSAGGVDSVQRPLIESKTMITSVVAGVPTATLAVTSASGGVRQVADDFGVTPVELLTVGLVVAAVAFVAIMMWRWQQRRQGEA